MIILKRHKLFVIILIVGITVVSYNILKPKIGQHGYDEYYRKIDASQKVVVTTQENPEISEANSGPVTPAELINYAQTLIGTPYKYGSMDPEKGLDCSGYINHVFNHFNIPVPRSSIEFTSMGREIALGEARSSDLILFTGTDRSDSKVGHIGIVVSNNSDHNNFRFIHSTSGKAHGVTITLLNEYYMKRFVKVIRIFGLNDE